jgi:hypothetical protein
LEINQRGEAALRSKPENAPGHEMPMGTCVLFFVATPPVAVSPARQTTAYVKTSAFCRTNPRSLKMARSLLRAQLIENRAMTYLCGSVAQGQDIDVIGSVQDGPWSNVK